MDKFLKYFFGIAIIGLGVFVVGFGVQQYYLLRLIGFKYKGVSFGGFGKDGKLVINIALEVTNASKIDVNITGYNLYFLINNEPIANLVSTTPGYIAAAQDVVKDGVRYSQPASSIILMTALVPPGKVLKNLFSKEVFVPLLTDYSAVTITLKGTLTANHRGAGIKDYSVNISDQLSKLMGKGGAPSSA